MANRRGLLLIISSPSGAGKSTLAKRMREWDETIQFSVSATTRPARDGEQDGKDYYFVSQQEFARMIEGDEMLEHAQVFENSYGSPRGPVQTAIEAGNDILFDIDWQGGQQIRNSTLGSDAVSIFILPPSIAALEERLRSRGKDSEEVITKRMQKSQAEISHWAEYDYVLVNNDLDTCEAELKTIISAERLRRNRRSDLAGFVRKLDDEFGAR